MFNAVLAAVLSVGLVVVPGAVAAGSVSPVAPAVVVASGIDNAWGIENYRLSSMPPSIADLRRYNPGAADDVLNTMYDSSMAAWDYQRQKSVLSARALNPSGALSAAETAALTAQKRSFRVPAFKPKAVLKGVGEAGVAMLVYELGLDAVGAGFQAAGVDVDSLVCTQDLAPLLDLVTSADCSTWTGNAPGFVPNVDLGAPMPAGWRNDVFWWGGTAGIANPHWVGRYSGAPQGSQGSVGVESLVWAGTSDEDIRSASAVVCRNFSGGSFSVFNPFWSAFGPVGATRQNSFSCGGAAELWAVGRLGNVGAANAILATPGGNIAVWMQNDAGAPLYFSPVSPMWTPAGEVDPERTLSCEVVGDNGLTYTAVSAPFRETAGISMPQCPELPAGVRAANGRVVENGGGQSNVLYDQPVATQYQERAAAYPQCLEGQCSLDLLDVTTAASCFTEGEACDGWYTDPAKETKYSCVYGGGAVALEKCVAYRQVFDPAMRSKGFAYSNPVTGQIQLTQTAPAQAAKGLASPADIASCMGEAWATGDLWNGIFSPVRCVLVWAFIPDPSAVALATGQFEDSWLASSPAKFVAAATVGLVVAAPESGCQGIAIDMSWVPFANIGTYYFLAACPGDFFAQWAAMFKVFLYGGIGILGLMGITRHLARIFNYGGIGGE